MKSVLILIEDIERKLIEDKFILIDDLEKFDVKSVFVCSFVNLLEIGIDDNLCDVFYDINLIDVIKV